MKLAGGETNYALSKSIYVLKADGSVRRGGNSTLAKLTKFQNAKMEAVEAGDVVVIPTNLDYERPLERISSITEVVFQSVSSRRLC